MVWCCACNIFRQTLEHKLGMVVGSKWVSASRRVPF